METNKIDQFREKKKWYGYTIIDRHLMQAKNLKMNIQIKMQESVSPRVNSNQNHCSCNFDVYDWKFQDYMFDDEIDSREEYWILSSNNKRFEKPKEPYNYPKNIDSQFVKIKRI